MKHHKYILVDADYETKALCGTSYFSKIAAVIIILFVKFDYTAVNI